MFCDHCGTRLLDVQRFCPACGKPAGVVPFMPQYSRIAGHVRLLGILWLALSALLLLQGFVVTSIFAHGAPWYGPGYASPFHLFLRNLMRMIGMVALGGGVVGIIAGWGLLERQSWARTLAIVLGCFALLNPPFGTALGIYTLWVLLPSESEQEYRRIARAA